MKIIFILVSSLFELIMPGNFVKVKHCNGIMEKGLYIKLVVSRPHSKMALSNTSIATLKKLPEHCFFNLTSLQDFGENAFFVQPISLIASLCHVLMIYLHTKNFIISNPIFTISEHMGVCALCPHSNKIVPNFNPELMPVSFVAIPPNERSTRSMT